MGYDPRRLTGYRLDQLAAAFDRVRHPRDWKAPIRAVIASEERPLMEKAVLWFTDSMPAFEPVPGEAAFLVVVAAGYRTAGVKPETMTTAPAGETPETTRRDRSAVPGLTRGLILAGVVAAAGCTKSATPEHSAATGDSVSAGQSSAQLVAEGRQIFRFDTFGNEPFWTDTLHLNEVVEKAVDPTTALKVGLKVDAAVLPPGLLQQADLRAPPRPLRSSR